MWSVFRSNDYHGNHGFDSGPWWLGLSCKQVDNILIKNDIILFNPPPSSWNTTWTWWRGPGWGPGKVSAWVLLNSSMWKFLITIIVSKILTVINIIAILLKVAIKKYLYTNWSNFTKLNFQILYLSNVATLSLKSGFFFILLKNLSPRPVTCYSSMMNFHARYACRHMACFNARKRLPAITALRERIKK